MSAQKGKELLLQVNDGTGTYKTVGGFKTNNFTVNGNKVDVTTKDSNGFKEYLDGGINVSISTSASGVFMGDDEFETIHAAALAGTHLDCKITIPGFMTYTGPFVVSSLTMAGDDETAVTYDMDVESAGAFVTVAL